MKLALNGATTMHADLETDINAAGAAGYDLVELWASKLRKYLETHSIGELKTLLTSNNVEAYSINSIEHITFRTAEDYELIKAECGELSAVAGQIACPYIVVVPGKLPESATEAEIIAESVRVLNERVLSLQSAPTQASDEPARRRTKRRDRNSKRQHEPANGVQERE